MESKTVGLRATAQQKMAYAVSNVIFLDLHLVRVTSMLLELCIISVYAIGIDSLQLLIIGKWRASDFPCV